MCELFEDVTQLVGSCTDQIHSCVGFSGFPYGLSEAGGVLGDGSARVAG
ncbi:hypothetical protein [Streptomyces nondiastaticus]|uniref:Uncharacterized protein n=1 Tax=Streptomyces nondiastaticus TaxID=3154512 RepID=A0ABW6TRT4_9ACTN